MTFTGTATLGYNFGSAKFDGNSENVNFGSARVDSTLTFSDNFEVGLGLTAMDINIGGTDVGASALAIKLAPRYRLANGLSVGAYYENGDLDLKNAGALSAISPEHVGYGLTLGYDTAMWDVEGFIGTSEIKPLDELVEYDVLNIGLRGNYQVSDAFELGGHVLRTNLDVEGTNLSAYSLGVGGFYDITDKFTAFAGVSRQWGGESGIDVDLTGFSVGVSYDIESMSQIPATLNLELVRMNGEISGSGPNVPADLDQVRVGVSIPLGGKTPVRPLNSYAYQSMQGAHDIVGAILPLY